MSTAAEADETPLTDAMFDLKPPTYDWYPSYIW